MTETLVRVIMPYLDSFRFTETRNLAKSTELNSFGCTESRISVINTLSMMFRVHRLPCKSLRVTEALVRVITQDLDSFRLTETRV